MPKHSVEMTIPTRRLQKETIKLRIFVDDVDSGRLEISNATVKFTPKNKGKAYKIPITDLTDLILEHGTKEN